MTVKIRFKKMGAIRKTFYRLVVTDSRSSRDGKYIESIGHYNPRSKPALEKVNVERAVYWLKNGAQPTEAAHKMLVRAGAMKAFREKK